MKLLLPLRHGLAGALRHWKLVILVYLLSLLPALVVAYLAMRDFAPFLGGSLFARRALEGDRMAVWNDLLRADGTDFSLVVSAALAVAAVVLVLHVLTAAGVVESLLRREHRREHPFLLGVGRHAWRFTRSAAWFALSLGALAVVVGVGFHAVNEMAARQMDGRVHLWGWLAVSVVALLVYAFLDLGYDLSRVAVATHDEGSTFLAYLRGLLHALAHPLILLPFWLLLSLAVGGLHLAYVAGRAAVQPASLGHVALVVLAQQAVFLLAAYLRVALWAGEVAYYQAAGEPRWAMTRRHRRAERAAVADARARQQERELERRAAARREEELRRERELHRAEQHHEAATPGLEPGGTRPAPDAAAPGSTGSDTASDRGWEDDRW